MSLVCEEEIQVKVKIDTGADTNTLTKRAWALIREAVITNGVTKLNEQPAMYSYCGERCL